MLTANTGPCGPVFCLTDVYDFQLESGENDRSLLDRDMIGQFARYCLVGALNTGVGLGVIFAAMAVLHLSPAFSNAFGFGAGFVLSFVLNRQWTFQSQRPLRSSLPLFALICAVGYALNLTALMTAIHIFEIFPYLAQLIGVGVYTIFVFLGSRFLAFRN